MGEGTSAGISILATLAKPAPSTTLICMSSGDNRDTRAREDIRSLSPPHDLAPRFYTHARITVVTTHGPERVAKVARVTSTEGYG